MNYTNGTSPSKPLKLNTSTDKPASASFDAQTLAPFIKIGSPADQEQFLFTIEGLDDHLRVLRFNGRESISKPFHFEWELATENPELPLKDLLGKGGLLTIYE